MAVPHGDSCGAIRLKVRGRDAGGRVRPGDEYRHVLDTVCRWLEELVDRESGAGVVEDITRVHEACTGPLVVNLPDLFVHWSAHGVPRAIASPTLGLIESEPLCFRPGDHAGDGWVITAGDRLAAPNPTSIATIGRVILRALGVDESPLGPASADF